MWKKTVDKGVNNSTERCQASVSLDSQLAKEMKDQNEENHILQDQKGIFQVSCQLIAVAGIVAQANSEPA